MRYVRIFLLHFQDLLAHRSRSIVYVFTYVFNALLFLALIRGVFANHNSIGGWTLSTVTSYYFLLILAPAFLMTHPETAILRDDIEKGELASRLLKPFPYYWQRFYREIPYRIFQGVLAIFIYLTLSIVFGNFLKVNLSLVQIVLITIILILAYMISFTFKMIIAIIALWTTDLRGIQEFVEVIILIFSGFIMPVNLLPHILEKIAYFLPFSYMIYFPVIAIQGKLTINAILSIAGVQIIWLTVLVFIFRYQWRRGLINFTDLGH